MQPELHHPVLEQVNLDFFDRFIETKTGAIEAGEPVLRLLEEHPVNRLLRVSPGSRATRTIALNSRIFVEPSDKNYNPEKEQVAYTLFFNSLRQIAGNQASTRNNALYRAGQLVPLQSGRRAAFSSREVQLTFPNGAEKTLPAGSQAFVGEYTGIYEARLDTRTVRIPVNLLDEQVSSAAGRPFRDQNWQPLIDSVETAGGNVMRRRPVDWLLLTLILLLITERVYFIVKANAKAI